MYPRPLAGSGGLHRLLRGRGHGPNSLHAMDYGGPGTSAFEHGAGIIFSCNLLGEPRPYGNAGLQRILRDPFQAAGVAYAFPRWYQVSRVTVPRRAFGSGVAVSAVLGLDARLFFWKVFS